MKKKQQQQQKNEERKVHATLEDRRKPAWYEFCQGVFIIQSNFCRVKDDDKLNTTIVNLQYSIHGIGKLANLFLFLNFVSLSF